MILSDQVYSMTCIIQIVCDVIDELTFFRNEVRWIRLKQDLVQLKILDDVWNVTIRNETEKKIRTNLIKTLSFSKKT